MKKFCLVSLSLVGFCVGACTTVDPFFGNELVPPSQQMTTGIDTIMPLTTYQIVLDSVSGRVVGSVASAISPMGYVGSIIDPLVGRTTVGTVGNFVPDAYTKNSKWKEHMFGTEPTVDSMKLLVVWRPLFAVGDTTKKFKVKVYPINQRLHMAKFYPTSFNLDGVYDPGKPLVEFMTSGADYVALKLPQWYADQFITAEYNKPGAEKPYANDSIFLDLFKGLYFQADPIAPGSRGAIGGLDLQNTELRLYYHNRNTATKPDTTSLGYYFYYENPENASLYYTPFNTSFVVAKHDYSLATDPRGVDAALIDKDIPCSRVFVQGLGGLAVRAELDLKKIEALQQKAAALGYRYVAVHRAELRWKVPERTMFYYENSFASLVMGNWDKSRKALTPLPDYNPWSTHYGSNSMGGSLVRSVGYYLQDITSYVQELFSGKSKNGSLVVLPDYGISRDDLDPLRSALVGSDGPIALRPELIVTYTLIR